MTSKDQVECSTLSLSPQEGESLVLCIWVWVWFAVLRIECRAPHTLGKHWAGELPNTPRPLLGFQRRAVLELIIQTRLALNSGPAVTQTRLT